MQDSGKVVYDLAMPLRDFLVEKYGLNAKIIIDSTGFVIVEEDFGGHFEG